MDLTASIAPRSDQLNADDLIAHPITVTITAVTNGTAEQPVNVELQEFPGRPYKPSKSMRRVMVVAWGAEASNYTGRRLELFRNPDITFGRDKVGGIEIAAMSDIEQPLTISLTATRGKKKPFTVQPLSAIVTRDWMNELELAGNNIDAIAALGTAARNNNADTTTLETIRGRYTELKNAPRPDEQVC